jgi:DnaJ-domain-containing protein 1
MEQEELSLDTKLKRLHKLALELEDAKSKRDQKIGERTSLLNTLRVQFGQNDRESAQKRLVALEAQLTRSNAQIDKAYKELMAKYEI